MTSEYVRLTELGLLIGLLACGCQRSQLTLQSLGYSMTVAVAPALNHSGNQDFDPVRAADLMASELTYLPGVKVIPLNRTLAQLSAEGKRGIESPAHALQIMDRLGADGIVVFAVTEYDPYSPPVLGLSAQLYGYGAGQRTSLDPVALSRQGTPTDRGGYSQRALAEHQRVYDGDDREVIKQMKRFARRRIAPDCAYGWRKCLASSDEFWRFCCAATAQDLIHQEVAHVQAMLDRQLEVAGQ